MRDTLPAQALLDAGDEAGVRAVTDITTRTWTLLSERRPWTVFTTCTGSVTWWVAGGEADATTVFTRWLGRNPYRRCGQCGNTDWRIVDVAIDAVPTADDAVLDSDDRG